MILDKDQQKIHDDTMAWIRANDHLSKDKKRKLDPYVITGYAGTGKTTLAKTILSSLSTFGYTNKSAAFTGKAAKVLQSKGIANAKTIHSCIYKPKIDSMGRLAGFELFKEGIPESVFFVDEASMVSTSMMTDIRKVAGLVVAMGDIGQLPPVTSKDDSSFMHDVQPNSTLTKIRRQAEDSDIIKLASFVREKGVLPNRTGWFTKLTEDQGTDFATSDPDQILNSQIIVFTNHQRQYFNNRARTMIHGNAPPEPIMGDKIICCKNQYNAKGNLDVSNGLIMYVCDTPVISKQKFWSPRPNPRTNKKDVVSLDCVTFDAYDEYGEFHEGITCPLGYFDGTGANIPTWLPKDIGHFEYGYAITCHRSQGSEWDNIIVAPGKLFAPQDNPLYKHQWLYTAITRARENVIVV